MIAAVRPGGARERVYASTTDTYDEALDLDYVAIELALNGEPVTLTRAEKVHAARILAEHGASDYAIAARLGTSKATVGGWRATGWAPPAPELGAPKCGEPRMYRRHLRAGETPDQKCRDANTAANRERKRKQRRLAAAHNQQRSAA